MRVDDGDLGADGDRLCTGTYRPEPDPCEDVEDVGDEATEDSEGDRDGIEMGAGDIVR